MHSPTSLEKRPPPQKKGGAEVGDSVTKPFEKRNTKQVRPESTFNGKRGLQDAHRSLLRAQPSNIGSENVTKEANVADDSCHRLSETEAKALVTQLHDQPGFRCRIMQASVRGAAGLAVSRP